MRDASPLNTYNRFSCLEEVSEIDTQLTPPPIELAPKPPEPSHNHVRRPRWERNRVPRQFVIASTTTPARSLDLPVELRTTDTGVEVRTSALVDSGATGSFIDRDFVAQHGIATRRLARPVPVLNVDGSPNEAGQITEIVDLILRYKRHAERVVFAVTGLGKKNVILGYTWLREHNPEINWEKGEVTLSRCPRRCTECRDEVRAEKSPKPPKAVPNHYGSLSGHRVCFATMLQTLKGSTPELPESPDVPEDDEEKEVEAPLTDEPSYEEGDRLYFTSYRP